MSGPGILFDPSAPEVPEPVRTTPPHFHDLGVDQVVARVPGGGEEYDLQPAFAITLRSVGAVRYRHDVFRDLSVPSLHEVVVRFGTAMRAMRVQLARADASRYRYQRERWFLDAAGTYADALRDLAIGLADGPVASAGLRAIRDHVTALTRSDDFAALVADVSGAQAALATVRGAPPAVRRARRWPRGADGIVDPPGHRGRR